MYFCHQMNETFYPFFFELNKLLHSINFYPRSSLEQTVGETFRPLSMALQPKFQALGLRACAQEKKI